MKRTNHTICLPVKQIACCLLAISFGFSAFGQLTPQPKKPKHEFLWEKPPDELFAGFAAEVADFHERVKTYGALISYVHPLTSRLGVMGNTSFTFGKIYDDANYSKFSLHGGICLVSRPNKIFVSPHLLAGIVHDQIKYTFDNSSYTSKGTEFSAMAGANVSVPVNNRISVVGRLDYVPTFSDDGIKNNYSGGVGVNINLGRMVTKANSGNISSHATQNEKCHASKDVRELKISFTMIERIAKSVEEAANKIPRVEAKVYVRPEVTVRQGEECCSEDKLPSPWTEIKGGVEGGYEVNINLWGIPDLNYSLKLWPVLLIAQFQCKLFAGPTGKISLEPVGRFYGELLGERKPDCSACFYWNLKADGFIRIGVKAGGKVALYHWSPLAKGEAGFDVTGEADEEMEVSGEASASIGEAFNGTYVGDAGCQSPQPGLHGVYKFGKAKANVKFTIKLGPISCDPSWEFNIFDGFQFAF